MEFIAGVSAPVRARLGTAEVRRFRGKEMPSEKSWETGEGRDGRAKQIRSKGSIIPNKKSSQGSPRQACVFKALQKLILCGSLFAEEAWLGAPAAEERMLRLQACL